MTLEFLAKYYEKSRGITKLDLSVEKGEFFSFIGPKGAGKSTTIRTLPGLVSPTSGNAQIFGKDVLKLSADMRKMNCAKEAKKLCERLQLDGIDDLTDGNGFISFLYSGNMNFGREKYLFLSGQHPSESFSQPAFSCIL